MLSTCFFTKIRSLLYVPGVDKAKLFKLVNPDLLCLDLEDSVPVQMKAIARQNVAERLQQPFKNIMGVRINALGTSNLSQDLKIINKNVHTIVVPKVNHWQDIAKIKLLLPKHIRFVACIETAKGLLNSPGIAEKAEELGISSLLFAAEDFVADLQMIRTVHRRELLYARSKISHIAKAYNLQAIDMVCVQFRNPEILQEEAQEAREMGFTGKQVIHPTQIDHVNGIFSPTVKQIERANKIIDGYKKHSESGKGAFELNGEVVDMPVVNWAENILNKN